MIINRKPHARRCAHCYKIYPVSANTDTKACVHCGRVNGRECNITPDEVKREVERYGAQIVPKPTPANIQHYRTGEK